MSTTTRITAQAHQSNLEALALLTPEQMSGMTAAYLRKLLSSISVYSVERDGVAIPVSRARKVELITSIYEMTTKPRVLAQVELTELSQDDIRAGLAGLFDGLEVTSVQAYALDLFERLRAYTVGQWNEVEQCWKLDTQYPQTLALEMFGWLHRYVTADGSHICDSTKVSYSSQIRNRIKALIREHEVGSAYATQLERHYLQFKGHNVKLVSDMTESVTVASKERADFRHANSQPIDPTLLLSKAESVLFDVAAGQKPRWNDASVALAIVTGRRQSEIHATATFTEITGETYAVKFEGQLKKRLTGKSNTLYAVAPEYEAYTIPTLVPAALVVSGHAYLQSLGKYCAGNQEHAHNRFSKDLAKYAVQKWFGECLPNVVNKLDESGKEVKARTYHRFREIYALIALSRQAASVGHMSTSDSVKYIKSIIGHGDVGGSFMAYDANFYLV